MRRKQLYAIILAGALAASSAPAAVMAAEGDVAAMAETSEETPAEGTTTDNSAAEETPAAATEAPAQETPATEAPAQEAAATEAPAQETAATEAPAAPAEQTQQTTEETPAAETTEAPAAGEGEEGTQTKTVKGEESTDSTGIVINETVTDENQAETKVPHYYASLQAAIDAAPLYVSDSNQVPVIEISGQLSLDKTVSVPANTKVCIRATNAVTITRKDASFKDDMFQVTGTNAELQFDVKEGAENASLSISGSIGGDGAESVEGAIVEVGTGASFGLGAGVTLTGNNTTADGGAITNNGGNIVLKGGTITGNTGTKGGGIYSNTSVNVQGTVVVNNNKVGEATSNICLDGATTVINVTDALTNSDISFKHANEADGLKVVVAGTNSAGTALTGDNFKAAFDTTDATKSQIKYENTAAYTLTLAADNLSATLAKVADPNPNPNPSTDTPTPTPAPLKLTYTSGSLKWENHSTVSLKMTADGACKWYYFFVDANTDTATIQAMYTASKATNAVAANNGFSVTAKNVPETDSWLVVCAKPDNGAKAKMSVIKLNSSSFKKKRPSATPSVTTRAAQNNKVSKSTVTGLENALKFFPGKFYEFSVTGAGQDITDPVEGDVRWIPLYWSTVKNPTTKQQNTTWRIGSGKGIQNGNTYNMYIFFKKQTYNGKEWQDTDVIQSITTKFTAATISDKEWKEYIAELSGTPSSDGGSGSGSGGDGGDGDETDAELTATAAASEKDASSKSKSAVSTADESPIGSMSALAALSLLAGGYIVVRKRKKEEQ